MKKSRPGKAAAATAVSTPGQSGPSAWLLSAALAVLCLLVFSGVLSNGYVAFDDDKYVFDNPHVRTGITGDNLAWAFTTYKYFYWQPLTWISHMLDVDLFGLAPAGHHLDNLVLHAINAVLLFWVLRRLTRHTEASAMLAALYAVHPLRVEPVAWIAERKELLAATFGWLTVLAHQRYTEQPQDRRRYFLVIALFAASLMAKPTWVVLPLLLLLLDWWPLRRSPALLEKLPLFGLSLVSGLLTLAGQEQQGAVASFLSLTPIDRLAQTVINYGHYLLKTAWPQPLAILYPLPADRPWGQIIASVAVLAAVSIWAWQTRRAHPERLAGWTWFVIALAPVSGISQSGMQSIADRFTYLPHVGLFLMAWPLLQRRFALWLGALLVVWCGITWVQVPYWRDSVTMFTHTLAVTGPNVLIEHNLGFALAGKGQNAAAIPHLERAVQLQPLYAEAHYNLGKAYAEQGRTEDAVREFAAAVERRPEYGEAWFSLGVMQTQQNRPAEAIRSFEQALRYPLFGDYAAQTESRIGLLLAQTGHVPEAIQRLQAASVRYPQAANLHNDLGSILAQQGRLPEATREFEAAVALNANGVGLLKNLALALAQQGRLPEARQKLLRAQALDPRDPQVRQLLEQWGK